MAFIITECEYCEGTGTDPYEGDVCPYCGGSGLE